MTEADFIIRAALSEETNSGWIWIQMAGKSFDPRTIVRIDRGERGHRFRTRGHRFRTYVEVRKIDDNFRRNYNSDPGRIRLVEDRDTLVMAEWYREALGILGTTSSDNEAGRVDLIVSRSRMPVWRSLRAGCHHPDLSVRLGTRLGMIGVWLGIVGIWLGASGSNALQEAARCIEITGLVGCIALAILGILASLGPRRLKDVE